MDNHYDAESDLSTTESLFLKESSWEYAAVPDHNPKQNQNAFRIRETISSAAGEQDFRGFRSRERSQETLMIVDGKPQSVIEHRHGT